jgi:hypothetical protein
VNDELDFALFKQSYEGAHGPGSFAAMLQVPEPGTNVLLLTIMVGLSASQGRHRRLRTAGTDTKLLPGKF